MIKFIIISLLSICFLSCIDPLDIRVPVYEKQLVVDGTVYDGAGPHSINLFYTSDLQDQRAEFKLPEPLSNALVSIASNDGTITVLTETAPGTYTTLEDELVAELGMTYQLFIRTAEHTEYQSTQQLLEASGEIDNLYFEFVRDVIYRPDTRQLQNAFVVWMDARADANSAGFLRWRYTGTFETLAHPEERTAVIADPSGLPLTIPDPLPCSGYESNGSELLQVGPCECCTCWVDEYDGKVRLSNAQLISSKTFSNIKVVTIPVDGERFHKKYSIEVEQLSITADAFSFWQGVESQQKGSGSLFQPNIASIKGNMQCVSNPEEEVLGIFSVSAVSRKRITIDRLDIPYCLEPRELVLECLQPPAVFFGDCRDKFERSKNVKPLFW